MSKNILGILVSAVLLTALVAIGATVDDKSVGTATYRLTENGTVMSLQVDRIAATLTNTTLSGGTITGAVQVTGSTLTGGTYTNATFNGGTVNVGTVSGSTLTNVTINVGTLFGSTATNLTINTLTAAGAGVSGFITNMPAGAVSTNACIWLTVKYGTNWVALPGFQVGAP